LQEKFRFAARIFCTKMMDIFHVNWSKFRLAILPAFGYSWSDDNKRTGGTTHDALHRAEKEKFLSRYCCSVFIDIVLLTGKFSYRSYFLPARGPTMFIQMRIKIRRKQRGKIT